MSMPELFSNLDRLRGFCRMFPEEPGYYTVENFTRVYEEARENHCNPQNVARQTQLRQSPLLRRKPSRSVARRARSHPRLRRPRLPRRGRYAKGPQAGLPTTPKEEPPCDPRERARRLAHELRALVYP